MQKLQVINTPTTLLTPLYKVDTAKIIYTSSVSLGKSVDEFFMYIKKIIKLFIII